ncbi:hypothetical protein GCM10025853_24150 [Tetragenococcus halophilus subsp. halophilus DSM 20339]|nr:hypothetical protein GCM10025853_24150 [Tetragenococcus halophilus subsp. halophilus DSM 20339]
MAKQKEDLKSDVSLLKDEDYVAKIARSRFLYSDDDEIVFPLPGNESGVANESDEETDESN